MKQMEQEKDILVQGLEAVDRAKDWYVKQINSVQDKMRYVGRIGSYMVIILGKVLLPFCQFPLNVLIYL